MKIIDAHTHILPPEIIDARAGYLDRDRWFNTLYASERSRLATADELVTSMDQAGIDASVAFGFAFADTTICRECNSYVLDAAKQRPDRILPFAVVNPCDGQIALEEARRCLEAGALGIGELMPEGQGYELSDLCLEELMAMARAFDVPVMVHVNELVGHAYPGKGRAGPEEAYRMAERFPENILILSHWGGGLPFYELMPEVRTTLRNVYYDTAASLYLYEDQIFGHVSRWAPTKVLFGSDYPLIGQRNFVRRVRQSGMDDLTLERMLGGNLLSLLHPSASIASGGN